MKVLRSIEEMRCFSRDCRAEGKSIALVPTMGFLHAGHFSLIETAKGLADTVVVSIFVNPTQFAPHEDLEAYPRDLERDCRGCEEHGAAAVFAPEPGEMYASNRSVWIVEEELSKGLCGRSRPIHFRGVCTVVGKLFNIVQPDAAVFGQKDAQQALIIRRMVRDLNFPVAVTVAPLVREADGLALSSRNKYLSELERSDALVLSRSLFAAAEAIRQAGAEAVPAIVEAIKAEVAKAHGRVDYVECLDSETLESPAPETGELLLALAAYFGKTRLIDNVLVKLEKQPCK